MSIVITGANGQLGQTLQSSLQDTSITPLSHAELNLAEPGLTDKLSNLKPSAVINCAAYTAVDKAENDCDSANEVNHLAVAELARACRHIGCRLIHISTDFVFDGTSHTPYAVDTPCSPLGVYGKSKYEGEQAILREYPENSCIVRTAWLYSANGNNFVSTMLRLMKERNELSVVVDQVGTPTSTTTLANFICTQIGANHTGIYHWTDAGVASWYDFAVAIYEEATLAGLLNNKVAIKPIYSKDYPTPAKRPHFSVLDKTQSYIDGNMPTIHWRTPLREIIQEIAIREQKIV